MTTRKAPAFTKPDGLFDDEWLIRLTSERADVLRMVKAIVHTSRSTGGLYHRIDRIDAALAAMGARKP